MKKISRIFIIIAMALMVVVPGQVQEVNAWQSSNVSLSVEEGGLDSLSATSSRITGHGWHAITMDSPLYNAQQYIFIMDKNTGLELARYKCDSLYVKFVYRRDVEDFFEKYGKYVYTGGFELNIPVTANMRGKTVYIMSRYTTDSRGDIAGAKYTSLGFDKKTVRIP